MWEIESRVEGTGIEYILLHSFNFETNKLKNKIKSKRNNQCFKIENKLKKMNSTKYQVGGLTRHRKTLLQLTLKCSEYSSLIGYILKTKRITEKRQVSFSSLMPSSNTSIIIMKPLIL